MKTPLTLLVALILAGTGIDEPEKSETQNISTMQQDVKMPQLRILSLYDNRRIEEGLKTSWGFACLIQTPDENILFDTGGDPETLFDNMEKMDVDPQSIHKVFISHIHGDHRGGLEGFLAKNPEVTVYLPASFPGEVTETIRNTGASYERVSGAQQIAKHIYSTGELKGSPSEQALIVESGNGLVVITGCAHPGIAGMVKKAKKQRDAEKIHLVMGGFHQPPPEVIDDFNDMGVMKVAPSHCTGETMIRRFREAFGGNFVEFGVGKEVEIR